MMYSVRRVANQDVAAVWKREMGGLCVPAQDTKARRKRKETRPSEK
jgi:hypothetical protein